MALKLKYTDEHGILHINMSPTSTPRVDPTPEKPITDPKFDTINNRFAQYDLFGGKYDVQPAEQSGGEEERSLFRSRYNSIEEELANTPYAFTSERSGLNSLNKPVFDITIKSRGILDDASPSKDIEDDRFFNRNLDDDLFGPQLEQKSPDSDTPAFTVTQLIHAQDRYFDLSSRQSSSLSKNSKSESVKSLKSKFEFRSAPSSAKKDKAVTIVERVKSGSAKDEAFTVLPQVKAVQEVELTASLPSVPIPTSKRKRESSFAIIAETPVTSRPASPSSLPVESRSGRSSPFRGRGFREETSRHSTPRASAAPSRATSPLPAAHRRTSSLSRIDNWGDNRGDNRLDNRLDNRVDKLDKLDNRADKLDNRQDNRLDNMAATTLPPPIHHTPHSPINFLKQNIEEVRELSELNREMHEAEAEKKKREEEEALLKEMEEFEKSRSVVGSRSNSRSNSPSKVRLRSRSSSPAAILHFENVPDGEVKENGVVRPERKSRLRSVSRSQPQSNNGSPKHSKIPKRQNSVSPSRGRWDSSKRPVENNLNRNQRFISNSTSSINDTIKLGSAAHDKRAMSKSTQHLSISPKHIKGKPPISPGRYGPPPSNKAINAKRLSPIVGTPNKSPTEDFSKPNSARTPMKPSPVAKKPVKTVGNTPATSRLNSRQPSRSVSRDPSPEKRRNISSRPAPKPVTKPLNKPVNRTQSTRTTVKPNEPTKSEVKKPINRTTSMKSLNRTPSTNNLNGKPPLKKGDSKKDLKEKAQSASSISDIGNKKEAIKEEKKENKEMKRDIDLSKKENKTKDAEAKSTDGAKTNVVKTTEAATTESTEEISKQDIQTQFDSITNEKGELIIMTKKNIVSMTTAAITSQPLEVVTAVTNQLPAALEKAREKAIFERNSSKDSLAPKDDNKETEDKTADDKKSSKPTKSMDDSIKMKLLQPPYNNPQVERARQKIEDILKSPEVSTENILTPEPKDTKPSFKTFANKAKSEIKETKHEIANKFTEIKDQAVKQNTKMQDEIRSEATKIVNSIITPVEEPKELKYAPKDEVKTIEPIVTVVNEKKTSNGPKSADIVVKTKETLVKGEPDVEVQSSNMSTPVNKMAALHKMADGNGSDKSASNGGFPQSTSTTPKPPARVINRANQSSTKEGKTDSKEPTPENEPKKQNICQRLMGKCAKKSNCCSCCIKPEDDELPAMVKEEAKEEAKKEGMISKFNCCKKKEKDVEEKMEKEIERAAGKVSLDFENETPHPPKRKLTSVLCCGRGRRVSDVSQDLATPMTTDCCGRRRPVVERRDSILSDRPPNTCCNNRLFNWMRGACRRRSEQSSSRRTSLFSKNKSLSPTLPPEDTRPKLDPSLVEHTSMIRGAIPVLPRALAWLCLVCNVVIPGLGTILSGLFCLCFGIPRFGSHDGAKYRIGAFVTNLFVGCGQLFTVLFCLVGWGWSIWWGVIMLRVSRKYRKLRAEAAAEEDQQPPPVTSNNHTRA